MKLFRHTTASRAIKSTPSRPAPAVMEVLEPRLMFSVDLPTADIGDALNFDSDTSSYLNAALGDASPSGTSYMIYDDWGGTWVDAEKTPGNTEDDLMCWAAAASNILDWTGWGHVAGMDNTDAIFQYFCDHWTDQGGLMQFGWDWWFDGTNNSQGWAGWSQEDVQGGGFYPGESIYDYYHVQNNDDQTMASIDSFLRSGFGTTVGIYGPGGHAITVWGFNYDESSGAYNGIWVTDSDDYKYTNTPPDKLRYYEVDYQSGRWYLQDYYGSNSWYIGTVMALEQMPGSDPVPEIDVEAGTQNNVHTFDFGRLDLGESASQTFTIRNEGTAPLVISALVPPPSNAFTVNVINGSGTDDDWTLGAGETFNFTVTFAPASVGTHEGTLTLLSNDSDESLWALELSGTAVSTEIIYQADMSSDPGWTLEGDWAYGVPAGRGGQYGYSDPESGATGDYVVGYNLSGDYASNISTTQYATTGAINCSGYENVSLSFQRWLGVENSTWDHANLQVRTAGGSWQTIWANTGEVTDSGWTEVTYDISDIADNRALVYIRWGMGSTDCCWNYCGWNIDDVEVTGERLSQTVLSVSTGDGDDHVLIDLAQPGGRHLVIVNGETTWYNANTYSTIELDLGAGQDTVLVHGTRSNDYVEFSLDGSGVFGGGSFNVVLTGSETNYFYSGGGTSLVSLVGSAGDDAFINYGPTCQLEGNGVWVYASNFDQVLVDGAGGHDTAVLYGQRGTDVASLWPTYGEMRGRGYKANFESFEEVSVLSSGRRRGRDRVYFYDSSGDDVYTFNANTGIASMSGAGYQNTSRGFYYHYAYATEGNDISVMTGHRRGGLLLRRGFYCQLRSRYGRSHAVNFEQTEAHGTARRTTFRDYGGVYGVSLQGRWRIRRTAYTTYMVTQRYGGTWADAEKSPSNSQDDMMCWAAAASNILEWSGWGEVEGISNTDEAFKYYQDHWTDQGGMMKYGWQWWFSGQNASEGYSGWSQVDVSGGGFFPQETFSDYYRSSNDLRRAPANINAYLQAGYGTTIGIYGPGGHALSVWGVRHHRRRTNRVIGIYVTDSDDDKDTAQAGDSLRYYGLRYNRRAGRWYLRGYGGSNGWYIGTVQGLARRGGTEATAGMDDFTEVTVVKDPQTADVAVDATDQQPLESVDACTDASLPQLAAMDIQLEPALTIAQPDEAQKRIDVQPELSPQIASSWLFGDEADHANQPARRLLQSLTPELGTLPTEALLRSVI